MMAERLRVAVMMGGLSAEHDVSVLTGLQILEALDSEKYDGFPVYIGLDHQWWVGKALRERKNFIPDVGVKRELMRVSLDVGYEREGGRWVLREVGAPFWRKTKTEAVDVVIPAMHGTYGEDGVLQGVLSAVGIPFVGGNVGTMAAAMNKMSTTREAAAVGVNVPKTLLLWRGKDIDTKAISKELGKYPLFVKPNFLGSSIGARVVKDAEDLEAAILEVFRLDVAALVQPCVANLVEYNVSARRLPGGMVVTSAIERPLRKGETLDFASKYLSGGGMDKLGNKMGVQSQGMASATRELDPSELTKRQESAIREGATAVFEALDLAGAPRFDFLCNGKTGEIFFNEVNPLPGSFGYFLWEGASPRVSFTDLLEGLIDEALSRARSRTRVVDPVGSGGAIFRKRG